MDARQAESRGFLLTISKSSPFIRGCRIRGRPWLQGARIIAEKGSKGKYKTGTKIALRALASVVLGSMVAASSVIPPPS
jgi:hypothetical protein